MAMDFSKVLVRDDVFNTTETIKYGVFKGGQNVTSAIYPAIGSSKSSQTYNIQVPSESTIISRHVMWESVVTLKVTYKSPFFLPNPSILKPLQYGASDALANFPLHQCASVMSATINNNTVSMNTQDILPLIMHMVKRKNLHRYSGTTPTAIDSYSEYTSDQYSNNNSLGGFQNSVDNDWSPRGSWVLEQLSTAQNPAPGSASFVVDDVVPGYDSVVYIKFRVSEPLLISPFIFGETYSNNQGFYGIKTMNFTFNMNDGARAWRSANIAGFSSVNSELINLENGKLNFMFYTPHPSMIMPARNVVGFYEMPRYITTLTAPVAPGSKSNSCISSNMQLSVIPDKVIVVIRKALSNQTCTDPEFWMTIKKISIQFNNQVGILSNTSTEQLYRMCLEAGSNQAWNEFNGKANITSTDLPAGRIVGTSGSMLVLDFAKHIQITEDYFAPGSLGTFQFQISVDFENNTSQSFGGSNTNLELVIVPMNSGLFVCERGTSSVYSGILTREDVLSASNGEQYSKSDIKRMVGGGLLDGLTSLAGYAKGKLPQIVEKIEDKIGDKMSGSGKKTEKAKNEIRDNRFY